jgi:hypothetical protein
MLATATELALVTAVLALVATSADAQNFHRRCAKAKDKVNCSCIFANGGQVYQNPGGRRRAGFATIGEYDAYARCMRRHGRFR